MWTYLNLIDYINIASANWYEFNTSFPLDNLPIENKKQCLGWIKSLNNIRQKTHHPEKESLSTEEVNYVKEIYEKVTQYFPDDQES